MIKVLTKSYFEAMLDNNENNLSHLALSEDGCSPVDPGCVSGLDASCDNNSDN